MSGTDLFRILLQKAHASGSRSTALNPLGWLLVIELSGSLGAFVEHTPNWFPMLLASLFSLTVLAYLGVYIFFAVRDRDALRSERFTLSRMAIERSAKGDTLAGFELASKGSLPLAEPASPESPGREAS